MKRTILRVLIEIVVLTGVVCCAVRFGWPWTVVFVIGYILAFAFKLPFLSRRTQVSTRFLVFLAIFLAFAMTASAIIGRFFFSENGQAWIEANRIRTFFLVTPALKMLWAAIVGFGLITIVATVILLPYGHAVAQNIYSQYEQYKGHEGEAVASAIGALLGINRGTEIVSHGQSELRGDPGGSLACFGGPGVLIVQEGHAVILEISGKVSRVVGRGITWLEPFERISMVVPLFLRRETLTVEKVATRDKVLIEEFEIQVFHKVDPGPPAEQIRDGQFAYTIRKLLDDVWSPSGGDWRHAVCSVAETATRDVVGRFELEEIVPISDTFRTQFREILTYEMNRVTARKMGVLTVTVDIGKIVVPVENEQKLLEKWAAQQQVQIAEAEKEAELVRAQAYHQNLRALGSVEAVATEQMLLAISAGVQASLPKALAGEAVVLLYSKYLEHRSWSTTGVGYDFTPPETSRTADHAVSPPAPVPGQRDSGSSVIATIRGLQPGQPLFSDDVYWLDIGILQGNLRATTEVLDEATQDLIEIDVDVFAQDMEIMPHWLQKLRYFRNRDGGLLEFGLRATKPGHKSIRVDFYYRQNWLQMIEFEVDVLAKRSITATVRDAITQQTYRELLANNMTSDEVIQRFLPHISTSLSADQGIPLVLRLMFGGVLLPRNASLAESGVDDGAELTLLLEPSKADRGLARR